MLDGKVDSFVRLDDVFFIVSASTCGRSLNFIVTSFVANILLEELVHVDFQWCLALVRTKWR